MMRFTKYFKATIIAVTVLMQTAIAQSFTLSLNECRTMALEQNRKIKSAQYEIDAAKSASEAANLNDRPSFDASLMGVHAGKPLDKLLPPVFGYAGVDIKQPLFAGGKINLGKQAYSKATEVYEGRKAVVESDVLLDVETAYWQVVQVKEKIVLANKYKEMLQVLQKDLKNAFDAGLTYKNDLLRAEVNLNEAELNINKVNDGLILAKLNLAQVIGQAGNADFNVQDSVTGEFAALLSKHDESVLSKRPEINLLQKSIEAQQIQTKIIKADLKPTVGVAVSGLANVGRKINFSNGNNYMFTYYGMISATVPIFDWGKTAKKVREQDLKIKARQEELLETNDLISLQAQSAYLQLNQSVKNITLSTLSLQQADENLRLANDRYKAGTIIGKDVLEAQVIWQQAYTSLIDARIAYKVNEANYRRAIGELK